MPQITTRSTVFILKPGESLLEGLERTGHEVEYQCRNGYCGSCRLRIDSGSVSYLETPLAFIGYNEILPCCCIPNEDLVIDCTIQKRQPGLFEYDLFTQSPKEKP